MNIKLLAYIGFITIFLASILGSSMVFFLRKKPNEKFSLIINGLAAGVMFSASIFGLITPSINQSEAIYTYKFIPPIIGLLCGCIFLFILDLILSKTNKNKTNVKLLFALTIHNIPEGIAIGLAFSLALATNTSSYLFSAISLTIGIALQNIPENLALSLSLYNGPFSKGKSFIYGVLSSIVEPIFSIIFFYISINISFLLPYLLSFAGGSMIYLTLDELLPNNKKEGQHPFWVWSFIIGFCLMVILECI